MNLQKKNFDDIVSGKKTIEIRLLDEKRSKIHKGDIIRFWCSNKYVDTIVLSCMKGNINQLLTVDNFKNSIPDAETLNEAISVYNKIYGNYLENCILFNIKLY